MGLSQGRAKRLESAIGTLILVILILIAVVVLIQQSSYDMSRFGIITTSIKPVLEKAQAEEKTEMDLALLAPAGYSVWSPEDKKPSETESYTSENLFEKINGKAPLYTESGFKKLYTQRFVNEEDPNLSMELYLFDMGGIKNAFSVYSVQKRADGIELPDMGFAYATSNALFLVQGQYYMELIGWSQSARLSEAMTEVAKKIIRKVGTDTAGGIPELNLFDAELVVPGGFKLYLAGAFGFEGLSNTFTAQYRINDETVTVFFSKQTDTQQARKVAESYYQFLLDNGGTIKPANNQAVQDIGGWVVDLYGDIEIVFSTGSFAAGVHAAQSQSAAEEAAAGLIEKLNAASKEGQ